MDASMHDYVVCIWQLTKPCSVERNLMDTSMHGRVIQGLFASVDLQDGLDGLLLLIGHIRYVKSS